MTNEERMSYWKGGNPANVLRFTSPYDYEDCIIGVSTDGHAVYDYMAVMEYIYEQEKDNYNLEDYKDEDDLRYNIMHNASDMISHDLSCYAPDAKVPVFCRVNEYEEDEAYYIHDGDYNFSECILGSDFREDRYIFSLKEMVSSLMVYKDMSKNEAIDYVYSLKNAGKTSYDYIIVDDLYEDRDEDKAFSRNNDKYSPELEENCMEFTGEDFLSAISKLTAAHSETDNNRAVLNYYNFKKSEENEMQIIVDGTDGRLLLRTILNLKSKSNVTKSLCLYIPLAQYLLTKIEKDSVVKLFEGNGYFFVKVNDNLFSVKQNDFAFPNAGKVIPGSLPYSASIKASFLKEFLEAEQVKGLLNKGRATSVNVKFADNKVYLLLKEYKTSTDSSYNCEEGFSFIVQYTYLQKIFNVYKNDVSIEFTDSLKAFKINQDNTIFVFMPMKEDVNS